MTRQVNNQQKIRGVQGGPSDGLPHDLSVSIFLSRRLTSNQIKILFPSSDKSFPHSSPLFRQHLCSLPFLSFPISVTIRPSHFLPNDRTKLAQHEIHDAKEGSEPQASTSWIRIARRIMDSIESSASKESIS